MGNRSPEIVRRSDVEPEEISWLWKGFIPLGKITLLEGDPGLGKSTLTIDIAARISTGRAFPDGTLCERGNVLLLSAEDDPHDTIRPRLEAAGGDPNRVVILSGMASPEGKSAPSLPRDIEGLEEAIRASDARLVIIDPLTAFLGEKVDSHKDQHVRSVLSPLGALGRDCGVAILPIRHLNKNTKTNALYRGAGSIGIAAAARSVLLIAQHPTDPTRRVLAAVKSNLSQRPPAFEFSLESTGTAARIVWLGESQFGESFLSEAGADPQETDTNLETVLLEILEDGPARPLDIFKRLKEAGFLISERTVRRVRNNLGIRSTRIGFGPSAHYLWSLPGQTLPLGKENNDSHLPDHRGVVAKA